MARPKDNREAEPLTGAGGDFRASCSRRWIARRSFGLTGWPLRREKEFAAGRDLDIIRKIRARLVVEQQPSETLLAKRPVPHRAAVEMDEARIRIPADPAAPHRAGRQHRILEPGREIDVEGAAVEMLAALGHAEHGSRQHRVGLRRSIRRQHGRPRRSDRIEDAGQEVEHLDIDRDRSVAAEVAQEMRQFLQAHPGAGRCRCDRGH